MDQFCVEDVSVSRFTVDVLRYCERTFRIGFQKFPQFPATVRVGEPGEQFVAQS